MLALRICILAAVFGCSRSPDTAWLIGEEMPPLLREVAPIPPPGVYWSPRVNLFPYLQATWQVRVDRQIRQRATGVPTLTLSVEEELTVQGKVVDRSERHVTVRLGITAENIVVEPPIEAIETEVARGRQDALLKITTDSSGKVVRTSRVRRQAGEPETLSPLDNDFVSMLKKLWPIAPERPVQVGDIWPFSESTGRALPGGGTYNEILSGRYIFIGFAEQPTGLVAVVSLDYEVTISGPARGAPRLDGTGRGAGVFFLDTETGRVLRGQIVESAHVKALWSGRGKAKSVEQISKGLYEITVVEETP